MKLLLLDQFSDPGGGQQALLAMLPAFRERGWDVVVGLPGDGPLFDRVRAEGCEARRIDCGAQTPWRKTAVDVARFGWETPRLARQIAALAEGVDVVYVNGPRLLPAAALAGFRAPVLFHAHSYLGAGMARRLAGVALRRLEARVVANCEFVAAAWRRYAKDVQVVFGGVPPSTSSPARDGRSIACVGRIAPEKGQLEFVEAAGCILRCMPEARFTIYGSGLFSGAAYEAAVRRRAASLPVEFAGWAADCDAALARTDVLLVPSAPVEATTRVILEAYAAGVPVVAFASGGIPEVVEHGCAGFLAKSTAEMARYTLALLRDPGLRAAMSAAGREAWERRFTLDRFRREVTAAVEATLRPAPRGLPLRPARGRSQIA
jgi:glycosyltransferase involved in cell wall biosynthesis